MSRRRLLFVLSADFGEYVTACLFARGQDFEAHYAVPPRLLPFVAAGVAGVHPYADLAAVEALAEQLRPAVVILASGYMYPVNRIARPEVLAGFVARLRGLGCALATTDPWLRMGVLHPEARLQIHSVKQGGLDAEATVQMAALQRHLEGVYAGVPHLFAVPLAGADGWLPFFNPSFVSSAPVLAALPAAICRWLFVLSREDYVFLAGFERADFFEGLHSRIGTVLSAASNQLTMIGPAELGPVLAARWPGEQRLCFKPFCDVAAFEAELRRSSVVAYWNTLSSSLLYCLYYRIPPIFFGKGHQARVCPGLYEHVVQHVYCGRAPALQEDPARLVADAGALVAHLGIPAWLEVLGREYAALSSPGMTCERLLQRHGR